MNDEPKSRDYLAEINVVPLVDVVLVLLIIFMVTAPLLYRGIDIQLPKSQTNSIRATERIVVTVEKDGKLFVGRERVAPEKAATVFAGLAARGDQADVYLRADQGVPYGVVVGVMDAMKKAGVSRIGMVTEPLVK